MTYEELQRNPTIRAYISRADESLRALGYTEHSFAHVTHVAETAGYILSTMGYDAHLIELAKIAGYLGGETLTGVCLKNTETGAETELPVDGVFLAVGTEPDNAPYAAVATLDERGYLIADEGCTTRTPGVFAAGDCRTKAFRQVATAIADGAAAALSACRYLDEKK